MCRVLEVSRSGYYRWLKRKPSKRQLDNQRLDAEIREIYDDSKGRYGSPKVTQELRDRGRKVSKNRVARRMHKAGLRSKIRRKYRVTTDSKHHFPVAPNLLERNFTAQAPDTVWVSDITYLATKTGWLYLTVIIDLFSRMVVGWALSSSLSHEMVVVALKRAISRRRPAKDLYFTRIVACSMRALIFAKSWLNMNLSRACRERATAGIMRWQNRFSVF
jgi:transposase InsO family protein